ncbi:MAG: RagB/SusD family nutrient uptake outer membrane protein [Saprospiraceae bacterium]
MKKYISIFMVCGIAACTKLDEKVYDKIPEKYFPENEAQAALNIIPTYRELSDLIDDAGWWFWAQEVSSDEIVFPVRLTDWEDGGKWKVLHTHEWNNNVDAVNSMWSQMYDGVFEANRAIDELLPFKESPAAKINIAKLSTLRALYYYLLIDNYGDVPYVTSFFTAEKQPKKNTRAEIHAALVKELRENLQYLPVSTNKYAVSKGLALTLLAKLYLNAEVYTGTPRWAEAEAMCDSVISLGIYQLESNPLGPFIAANENSIENIFTIPFDAQNLKGFRLHMRTLHYQSNLTFDMNVGPWNGFAATEAHYNSYEDKDLRKKGFLVGPQLTSKGEKIFDQTANAELSFDPHIPALVMDASYTYKEIRMSGARVIKYQVEKGALENLNNDFPIFRYADVLLMKAESVIRQNRNGDSYVNEVRRRAGVSDWNNTTLEMLLAERGREMFCEGHRRQDLIRFNKFNDAWWEKKASTPDRKVFPIPQWAIDANPNLGK